MRGWRYGPDLFDFLSPGLLMLMKRFYQQSSRFQATKAQIAYLRAIHLRQPIKTNAATVYRCYPFLEFREDGVFVKPEVVKQFNLDQE
jgi:hypothetical protein